MPEVDLAVPNIFSRNNSTNMHRRRRIKGEGIGHRTIQSSLEPRASLRDRYFLTIPSFFMRASSVVGFSPSASAAPPGPRTRQPVRSRMRKI
jgi:hypothetical protein